MVQIDGLNYLVTTNYFKSVYFFHDLNRPKKKKLVSSSDGKVAWPKTRNLLLMPSKSRMKTHQLKLTPTETNTRDVEYRALVSLKIPFCPHMRKIVKILFNYLIRWVF